MWMSMRGPILCVLVLVLCFHICISCVKFTDRSVDHSLAENRLIQWFMSFLFFTVSTQFKNQLIDEFLGGISSCYMATVNTMAHRDSKRFFRSFDLKCFRYARRISTCPFQGNNYSKLKTIKNIFIRCMNNEWSVGKAEWLHCHI